MSLFSIHVSYRDKLFCALTGGILSLSLNAAAVAIYAETGPNARSGRCIRPASGSATEILDRNGIKRTGHYGPSEIAALAKGVSQVERLNGSPLPPAWQTTFNFLNTSGAWNQGVKAINVRKYTYGGDNVAAQMHEFGHKIANANNQKILSQYVRQAKRCGISPYAYSKRSEEFAEVFSAFIVNPEDLKAKCPSAFGTMLSIFRASENVAMASCSNKGPPLPAQIAGKPFSSKTPLANSVASAPKFKPQPTPAEADSASGSFDMDNDGALSRR